MHQYLFFIGDFPIRAYGTMLALAIICGASVAYVLLKKDGRGWHEHIIDFSITVAVAGLIGARLWDVFFFDWQGGMAIQGGVVLGTIAGYWYLRKNKIDFWAFADLFAPALILAQSVGRMANLLNGDAFGHPTGGNYGIIYPESTLAYRTYGNQPLWPAEVWEGQIDILIFVVLLLFGSFKHAKGQVFVLYAILYSTARFFLEFLRGDYVNLTLGLKSAQMTSLIAIIVGICVFIYLGYLEKKNQKVLVAIEPTVKTKKRK